MTKAMNVSKVPRRQQGASLLSLMAGLVVSLISVLATLSIYQNISVVSADTKTSVVHDGQIPGSLLVAEKYVMNAGYGIVDAGVGDIKRVTTAGTSTTPATISLLWRYQESSTVVCAGLRESGITIGSDKYRTLRAIQAVSGCTLSADLTSLSWTNETAILGQWPITPEVSTYLGSNDTLFDFQIAPLTCSPFGYGVPRDHLGVTISIPGVVELNRTITAGGNQAQLCLSNFYP